MRHGLAGTLSGLGTPGIVFAMIATLVFASRWWKRPFRFPNTRTVMIGLRQRRIAVLGTSDFQRAAAPRRCRIHSRIQFSQPDLQVDAALERLRGSATPFESFAVNIAALLRHLPFACTIGVRGRSMHIRCVGSLHTARTILTRIILFRNYPVRARESERRRPRFAF
jgi:hypothetical protein